MIGQTLGHYMIIAKLGQGGMGEVYRAHDTKLNRDVAIKVLPESFAADAERVARFTREAQTLAAVNHPNIAAIYGIEDPSTGSGQAAAIVLELVEGDDLSQRIAQGAIGVSEALVIARQIADALDAAHAVGIVHRDLKPANIRITRDGHVKVLDFGLAKAIAPDSGPGTPDSQNSPTLTAAAFAKGTQMGVILGTAAYMAPEQARGRAVDKRADVWAFGCVLYEMVTGRRAFAGEDVTETLAAVVKDQPDLNATPPDLRRLIGRCLEKDPKKRVRDIGDVWDLLEQAPVAAAIAPVSRRAARRPWIAAAVGMLAAIGFAVHDFSESGAATPSQVRLEVSWPADISTYADNRGARFFQLSPDARHVVLVSQGFLWVRSFDSLDATRLERTQGATYPFWSPDSEWIAFFADGQLKKTPRTGGPVQMICDAPDDRGGAWSQNGTIVLASHAGNTGLSRVPENGGTPTPLTKLATTGPSDAHRYPQFLPDGEHFLYLHLTGSADVSGVHVGALDGSAPVRVLPGPDSALYFTAAGDGGGHLVFRRKEKLMAQPFDPARRVLSGEAFPVADVVGQGENTGLGAFSVANGGALAFGRGTVTRSELVWLDRTGKRQEIVSPSADINTFALSRDQRRLALGIGMGSSGVESQIWTQSLPASSPSKLTFDAAPGWESPVWSPSAPQIAFATLNLAGLGGYEIRRKALDSTGTQDTIVKSNTVVYLWDWSPDGKFLVYSTAHTRVNDLWMVPLDGKRVPEPLTKTPAEDQYGQISPDGRWLAYAAGRALQMQVFVQSFPAGGMLRLVSKDGGTMPRWSRDGKELYYRGSDGRLMAVAVNAGSGPASAFEHGPPQPLFGPIPTVGNLPRFTYQPSNDGQRFLVASPVASATPPITVVLNWHEGTKK